MTRIGLILFAIVALCFAADLKVDLSKEQPGKPPVTFDASTGSQSFHSKPPEQRRTNPSSFRDILRGADE